MEVDASAVQGGKAELIERPESAAPSLERFCARDRETFDFIKKVLRKKDPSNRDLYRALSYPLRKGE